MSNLLSVFPRIVLLAAVVFSPPHTLTGAAGRTVSEKTTVSTSALAELRQAVGAVATVASAKGGAAAFQQAAFSQINAQVTQNAAGVRIGVDDKQLLVLRNVSSKQDETGVTTYRYRGTDQRNQLVWITEDLYEETKQLLISQATGKSIEVANEPQLNLTSTLLFARQNDCYQVSDDCHPGFHLWRISKGVLQLIKQVRLKNYFVVNGGWISATTVRVETASLQDMTSGKRVSDMKRQFFDVTVR